MNIISFGCSFIYGSELCDQPQELHTYTPEDGFKPKVSQLTWPAVMANQLGYNYESYALPGIGNLHIAEQALLQLANNQQGLYVISWSWIDRFDYIDSKKAFWKTILPSDDTPMAHTYYRDLHSQYRDKLTSLMNIKLVVDALKQKNQPFIMTYVDDLLFETEWHSNPLILELQDYIRPHMTVFDGMTFLEWSRKHGYPESAHWHPLEQAHAAAANYILELGIHNTSR